VLANEEESIYGSSMLAMIFIDPPQAGQVSTSTR
jgi:hypothetical protein